MGGAQLPSLLDIAARAIEVTEASRFRALSKVALHDAYKDWKRRHAIGRVEADTLNWSLMMAETKPAYARLEKAKAAERNALRRLATAVRRYQEGGK